MNNIEILKDFLEENNLSQAQFAKLFNKDTSLVSKYLSGERPIPDVLIASLDNYDSVNNEVYLQKEYEDNTVKRIVKSYGLTLDDISLKTAIAVGTLKTIAYKKNHKLSETHKKLLEALENELSESLEHNILKKVLFTFNMNQRELADLLEVSPSAISGWNEKMPKMVKYVLELMLENSVLKNNSSSSSILIGDTVTLKSNSNIKMSIVEIKDNIATCVWFDSESKLQKEQLIIDVLVKSASNE